jgi:hypothetical protein
MDPAAFDQKLGTILDFSVKRLKDTLSLSSGLFDRQLRDRRWDVTLGTEEMTGTAICLIGIHRSETAAGVGLDAGKTLGALMDAGHKHAYAGGAGLSLWANAVWDGKPFASIMSGMGLDPATHDGLLGGMTTMEVAWLVSGLLHEVRRSGDKQAQSVLRGARTELLKRFRPSASLCDHCGPSAPFRDRLRVFVPNFADQVYSLQAFAFLAMEGKDQQCLDASAALAARLIHLQGGKGQWWWHYDTRTGKVAQPYPVYSVHQHGMAPMALRALAAAGGPVHEEAIRRSKSWLTDNERGETLIDETAGTIWRDIEYTGGRLSSLVRQVRSVLGIPGDRATRGEPSLHVNYETRPYEWAWCLYAAAIESGKAGAAHVV